MIVKTRNVRQSKTNAQDWPKEYIVNFLEAGLVSYEDVGAGIANLPKSTIVSMLPSYVGKPVVIDHIDVTPKDFKEHAVGYITRTWFDDYSGWAYCAFILTEDKAKQKVQQGYSVSCAYDVLKTGPGGEYHAIKYDETILEGSGTHLALVTSPRYEDCRILVNSKKAKITEGEGRKNSVIVKPVAEKENKQKEESKMIQLFKKANDKAGSEVDPKDPTKQKWNAEAVYVQIENEMVPLSELAKHAKENEYEAIPQTVENELEINGAVHNVSDLIESYKASKKNDDKDEKKEEKVEKKEDKKNEEKEEKKEEKEDKKNADDKDDKKKESEKDEEEDVEGKIKKNDKTDEKEEKKENKKDVKHFIKLNTARENGHVGGEMIIDTMVNRIDRGKNRYGTEKK